MGNLGLDKNLAQNQQKKVVDMNSDKKLDRIKANGREVFAMASQSIMQSSSRLDDDFSKLVECILNCCGRVIVCGMGKSGIIGKKMAASFASTGTPSFFMHPSEAFHGDLGMIKSEDILLLISYSGETEEVLKIVPFLKENKNTIVAMTGNPVSMLAKSSNYHLNIAVEREACPLQMAPTTSATVTLVMGDALAIALMKERGFSEEDYAKFHPGGNLGRMLLTTVEEAMVSDNLPVVSKNTEMKTIVEIMTSGRLGVAVVLDDERKVVGVVSDGDLRRALNKHESIFFTLNAESIMTANPKTITPEMKLYEAQKLFDKYMIVTLVVCDQDKKLLGTLQSYNK